MRRRFTRLTLGTTLAVGSLSVLGVLALPSAHALGPEGCAAKSNNGVLAVGTVLGTTAPAPPAGGLPTATCSYTALSGKGGFAGGDSVSWTVTVDTPHAALKDATGQPCAWVANGTGTSTWSGKGPASGGYGCILAGGAGTATVG